MKIFLESYGCTLNQGEGRLMAEMLRGVGHEIATCPDAADAFVLVTCTVIEATERRMVKRMKYLGGQGKPLVVAGCMASVQPSLIKETSPDALIVTPREKERIVELLPPKGKPLPACQKGTEAVDGIVPIAQGCMASCSYCISKPARGPLRSYPIEELVQQVERNLSRGMKEIRLSALDTAQYGRDMGSDLPTLVRRIVRIDGDFRIRVGMMSPMMMRPILKDLIGVYGDEKIYKFLHLPVQSGNDTILRRMKRGYRVEDFLEIVDAFRSKFCDLTLSTDVIAGFPGETEEQFEDTMRLMQEVKPDIINITRFSPRPGTSAAVMKDRVVGWRVKERSRRISALRFRLSRGINDRFVSSRMRVLTTERGKQDTTIARSDSYRPVIIRNRLPLGRFFQTEVTEAKDSYLLGRLI